MLISKASNAFQSFFPELAGVLGAGASLTGAWYAAQGINTSLTTIFLSSAAMLISAKAMEMQRNTRNDAAPPPKASALSRRLLK